MVLAWGRSCLLSTPKIFGWFLFLLTISILDNTEPTIYTTLRVIIQTLQDIQTRFLCQHRNCRRRAIAESQQVNRFHMQILISLPRFTCVGRYVWCQVLVAMGQLHRSDLAHTALIIASTPFCLLFCFCWISLWEHRLWKLLVMVIPEATFS